MFQIPTTESTIPPLMLEINQECNITCATCYQKFDGTSRSLPDLRGDLDLIQRQRRLQTVSIGGGEPTLHPRLPDIVAEIHRRDLKSALITNGVLVDRPMLRELKRAGLDMVMFHIDGLQRRPDLPARASDAQLTALRDDKVEAAGAEGVDAGLSFMLSRRNIDDLVPLIEYVLGKEQISTLLVTHSTSVDFFVSTAALARRDRRAATDAMKTDKRFTGRTTNDEVYELLREALDLEPFGYMPAREVDGRELNRLQWINYFVPVAYSNGSHRLHRTVAGRGDLMVLQLYWALAGRYLFSPRPAHGLMVAQLLLNGVLSRRLRETVGFLRAARRDGARIKGKRIAFDAGHHLTGDGAQRHLAGRR